MVSLVMEISPGEVEAKLDAGERLRLIHAREPFEFQQARIEAAELIPMKTVPAELQRLDAMSDDETLIVY